MPGRGPDVKAIISLVLSVLSTLMALGGIAYAAGSLTTRVDNLEQKATKNETVPERLASIEAKLQFLVDVEKGNRDRANTR